MLEAREGEELAQALDAVGRQAFAVAPRDLEERGGAHAALEVHVQLDLGEAVRRRHAHTLRHARVASLVAGAQDSRQRTRAAQRLGRAATVRQHQDDGPSGLEIDPPAGVHDERVRPRPRAQAAADLLAVQRE